MMSLNSGVAVLLFSIVVAAPLEAQQPGSQPDQQPRQPKGIVQQAVRIELNADHNDHTHWLFYEVDRKPKGGVTQWVAQTPEGDLRRVLEQSGQKLSPDQQEKQMESYALDTTAQAKQKKAGQHDDAQAEELLKLLPDAFLWTTIKGDGGQTTLHFKPNDSFHPPDREARVFAAMEGDMVVQDAQHRIVSLKGRLIRDIKFGGGFLATLKAGGTFDVERRQTSGSVSGEKEWQITETHVHIDGHALLFKSISEQEDDLKSNFKQLGDNLSWKQAEQQLMQSSTP